MKIALALLCCVLLAVAFWLYTPDISRAELDKRYRTADDETLTVLGVTLRVRDTGPRDGAPAILLLHGLGSSLETWQPWADVLSRRFRVIRLDLPGFGLTGADPSGDYSDQREVALLLALLDRLGVARVSVIGHSLGGRIAWQLAAAAPDRVDKLVLIAPDGFASPGFEYGKKPDMPWLAKLLPYVLPRPLLRMNLAAAYGDPGQMTAATLTRYSDLLRAPGVRQAVLDRMGQVVLQDPTPTLRTIRAPTLLLWGEKDAMIPLANAADYQKVLPDSRLVTLPGLGHVCFEENPDRSLAPVMDFLSTEGPAR